MRTSSKKSKFLRLAISWMFFNREIMVNIISKLFILLFVYAASSKLLEYEKFKAQLGQSPMLSPFASVLVWSIPAIEVILSVMLTVPRWLLNGLYLSFTLMTMFTAYIVAMLMFAERIPCSCGGILQELSWSGHIAFNAVFIALGVMGIILQSSPPKRRI